MFYASKTGRALALSLAISFNGVSSALCSHSQISGTVLSGTIVFMHHLWRKCKQVETSILCSLVLGFTLYIYLVADYVEVISKHNDDKQGGKYTKNVQRVS